MQILSSDQIRAWDQYTIQNEPIASLDLMERAAATCFQWIVKHFEGRSFSIFCAKGNNGGDGLAIARILSSNHEVTVYILEFGHLGTEDFQANLARLHQAPVKIKFISTEVNIPQVPPGDIIIDALLGSGLNRPIEGLTANVVSVINNSVNEIIAIDIPSGLSADKSSRGNKAIKATYTLSFQCYKPAFLLPENEEYIGQLHLLDIGLHPGYPNLIDTPILFSDKAVAGAMLKPRKSFSHKGNFGHALLVVGSYGKMGAAILAAKACLRAGVGLLTVHAPASGNEILQTSVPEAMFDVDSDEKINTGLRLQNYTALGIGPGIGTETATASLLESLVSNYKRPIVFDADALNILSKHHDWMKKIPAGSILTPHPKEFERMFGSTNNDFEKIELAKAKAKEYNVIVVLKGHYSFIATPGDKHYFNSTGNPGMATGGSGDVLTGIITALIAQQYSPTDAAVLGVYIHGLAGDIAASQLSEPSLIASDIIDYLGQAFIDLSGE